MFYCSQLVFLQCYSDFLVVLKYQPQKEMIWKYSEPLLPVRRVVMVPSCQLLELTRENMEITHYPLRGPHNRTHIQFCFVLLLQISPKASQKSLGPCNLNKNWCIISMHAPHPYLIFVIFCTPPQFLACKLYARKVRKFETKIASQQNSVNWY